MKKLSLSMQPNITLMVLEKRITTIQLVALNSRIKL